MTAELTALTESEDFQLIAQPGVMRLILHGALKDADLWARSNASLELKGHWTRRADIVRSLYDRLPPPPNPRDPYEDLPNEPTPEEAEQIGRERKATEETRIAARVAAAARRPIEETVEGPITEDHVLYDPDANEVPGCTTGLDFTSLAPVYDDDDLLA